MAEDDDFSGSVAWEGVTHPSNPQHASVLDPSTSIYDDHSPPETATVPITPAPSTSHGLSVQVKDSKVELEGTKDTFVSYLVTAITDLPNFASKNPSSRRRFQDFTFLREHLTKDFPAAVVPPLPDKHRLEYLTGDRFSPEFIERRRIDLQRFLERLSNHPTLSRTALFQNFLESTEWNVYKHKQLAHPSDPEPPAGLLDNLSDTLLNAFAKLRKPDPRFLALRTHLDQLDEGLLSLSRLGARSRARLGDLGGDYNDLAISVQGLGYLESGITAPLARFEHALAEFGAGVGGGEGPGGGGASEPFLEHVHSLLAYSAAFRAVLKLRDQKQLDFEELSAYLGNVASERERLAGGYGYGMGIGSYFKEKVESFRGGETDVSKEARLARLDVKVKELQAEVIASQETSQAFNQEVLNEDIIFQLAKRSEMKELLGSFADGQMAMFKRSMRAWDQTIGQIADA